MRNIILLFTSLLIISSTVFAQNDDDKFLTIDRIYSGEFKEDRQRPIQWIEDGNAFVTIEKSKTNPESDELIHYKSDTQKRSVFVAASALSQKGKSINIESFSLSPDGSKVLIFTNSSRVWRSNTKGDYWVYDFDTKRLKQLGTSFEASSLMFAKFSNNNKFVAYVHKFNVYKEDFKTGEVTQLTKDGNRDIINGTFDWVYEEEFGKRDGFAWSPDATYIAFWQLDASEIGTHYMINNTDSIYAQLIPLQYPKVGEEPSAAKIGVVHAAKKNINWVDLPGGQKENYIPGMQWVNPNLLLIQQLNRKQNELIVWGYNPSNNSLSKIYTETEDSWVDINYPDISANSWGHNDLPLINNGTSFLRLTENGNWRNLRQVNINKRASKAVTTGNFDVASVSCVLNDVVYYMASPFANADRYLYQSAINKVEEPKRLTPKKWTGMNGYNVSPNGKFAIHTHESVTEPKTTHLIRLPDHTIVKTLVDNSAYKRKLVSLHLPKVEFSQINTEEGITVDYRIIYPIGFDKSKKYPVIFHVYGEPWGQMATNRQIGLWYTLMAQKGYVIVNMDPRGTPCLKGSKWRKSIYRNVGKINVKDQGQSAEALLNKFDFLDKSRTAIWGWSGGGTMTLNMMFKYPKVFKTGISVAPVTNQLAYDNIYQERYMGLPQENREEFIEGSPMSHVEGLEGNLLLIHGTADDNVHYQHAEILINELIRLNKQFDMMAYPNRSHGIWEGENTRRHLYTLMTNYFLEKVPVNEVP